MCGNLSIVLILPPPEWFELRMGPRKGGGGWIGWASTWLYRLTRAWVWQTSVFFFFLARSWQNFRVFRVRKWEGGCKQCIFDCTVCHYKVQQKSMLERHTSIEHCGSWTKGSGGSMWRSLSKFLFITAFISPPIHPSRPQMNTSIFCTSTARQINQGATFLRSCIKPGVLSHAGAAGVTLVTGSRGYQGFTFPNQPLPQLTLLEGYLMT